MPYVGRASARPPPYLANFVRAPFLSSTGFEPQDSGITEIVTLPKLSVGPLSGRLKTLSPRAALKAQWKSGDKDREPGQSFRLQLAADEPELHKELLAALKDPATANLGDLAGAFFPLFSKRYPGEWPVVQEYGVQGKEKRKKLVRVKQSSEIQAVFFDLWRQEHPNVALEEVPADMVTTLRLLGSLWERMDRIL